MKIRRWEDRTVNVLVEYDLETEDINDALEILENSDYYKLDKKLIQYESVESYIDENEPMWIDSKNYWKVRYENKEDFIELDEAYWIIEDWAGNRLYLDMEFGSFDDGWAFIYENIEDIDNAYDDVFVVLNK